MNQRIIILAAIGTILLIGANLPIPSLLCLQRPEAVELIGIKVNLLQIVEVGVGARPEVVATDDRVFIVYLDTWVTSSAFSVKFMIGR